MTGLLGRAGAGRWRAGALWERFDQRLTPDRLIAYPAVALSLFLVVWAIALRVTFPMPDFLSRWTAGRLVLDGQVDGLYDPVIQSSVQAAVGAEELSWFVSPPFVALIFAPLALVPYPLAAGLWTVVSVALIWLSLWALQAVHPAFASLSGLPGILIAASCQPMLELIGAGQDTAIVLAAFAFATRLLVERHHLAAGLVLSLVVVKPQHMWLAPLAFVLFTRWRSLLAFLAGVASIVVCSMALLGAGTWTAWLEALASPLYGSEVIAGQSFKNTTIHGFIEYLTPGEGRVALVLWLLASGLVVALTVHRRRHLLPRGLPVVLITVVPWVSLLATPHAMVYDAVLLLPGAAWLVHMRPSPHVRVSMAVAYVLLLLAPALHRAAESTPLVAFAGAPWVVPVIVALWWVMLSGQDG